MGLVEIFSMPAVGGLTVAVVGGFLSFLFLGKSGAMNSASEYPVWKEPTNNALQWGLIGSAVAGVGTIVALALA